MRGNQRAITIANNAELDAKEIYTDCSCEIKMWKS